MRIAVLVMAASTVVCPAIVAAQSAATIPASSAVYDRIDALAAFLPIPLGSTNARPISNRDLRRALVLFHTRFQADSLRLAPRVRAWLRAELESLDSASGAGGEPAPRRGVRMTWRMEAASTDAPWTRPDTGNGLGYLDATTSAFAHQRDGWPLFRGTTLNAAPTMAVPVLSSGNLVLVAEPIVTFAGVRDSGSRGQLVLNRAYVRGVYHNVAVQLGRDETRWGSSRFGDLYFSGNAAPIPGAKIGTDTAVVLPWLFRLVGPTRATFMIFDLGRDQRPAHDKLSVLRVSVQPWTRVEIGGTTLQQTGGSGGPPASFGARVLDFFPLIDAIFAGNCYCSNRFIGGDVRLHLPELSGLELFYEIAFDDMDFRRRLRSTFVEDAGHLLAVRLPLTLSTGLLTLRGEWHRPSLRLYEHTPFVSGYTYHQRIIGDPLGPHARGLDFLAAFERRVDSGVELQLSDESRDPSMYAGIATPPRDLDFHFVRTQSLPLYREQRALLSLRRGLLASSATVGVGYDRAWRADHSGATMHAWLGQVTLSGGALRFF